MKEENEGGKSKRKIKEENQGGKLRWKVKEENQGGKSNRKIKEEIKEENQGGKSRRKINNWKRKTLFSIICSFFYSFLINIFLYLFVNRNKLFLI